jgi:tetratricopeptide (TPR) repeat protein
LDKKISQNARRLRRDVSQERLNLNSHYRVTNADESDALKLYVKTDVIHLHNGLVAERQDPTEFYKGYDVGFGCITQNLDIARPVTDSILVDAVLVEERQRKNGELFLIKGPGGNGKTVALKRVAWEAGTTYEVIALYANSAASFNFEALDEINKLTGKRIFLFVDRIALVRDELQRLLATCRTRRFPLTVIGAERENEWNIYCESLETFTVQEFSVAYLSKDEIIDLLALLERHKALGLLAEKSQSERIGAFLNRAESPLLVALHETTLGVPFEKIVLDEYDRVKPREAQQLYLQICALHQFGAPVRAGLISRASGIVFSDFEQRFLKPLADVVHVVVEEDRHSQSDYFYRSRHQHVAEMVFNQALPAAEDKYDLLANLIQVMNIDYSSDRETFSRLIRGRSLVSMFPAVELGRLLYEKAETAQRNEWFVAHQHAVFELHHPQGSLAAAEAAAARAAQLNPKSHSIQHTQAEIARRQALATSDPLKKLAYRRVARAKVSGEGGSLSEYDLHTRAKVAIDELREVIARQPNISAANSPALLAATKEAENAIQNGREQFPDSAEMLAAEASFRDLLNQAPQALNALERAFGLNPRQDWLAIRLAKRYAQGGEVERAIEVMRRCLRENPDSKPAHFQIAQLLKSSNGSHDLIVDHLRKSYSQGDNNFESQFWYARELFLAGRPKDAAVVFSDLAERAPGRFRTEASNHVLQEDGRSRSFDAVVVRKEEGYAFANVFEFGVQVFASRGDSARIDWDRIRTNSSISCFLAFSRRGPRLTNLTLRGV